MKIIVVWHVTYATDSEGNNMSGDYGYYATKEEAEMGAKLTYHGRVTAHDALLLNDGRIQLLGHPVSFYSSVGMYELDQAKMKARRFLTERDLELLGIASVCKET